MSTIVVLSGNPREGSRTSRVAARLAELVGAEVEVEPRIVPIELAELASEIFDADSEPVLQARTAVAEATLVIVATPVYKGSYTGLLKAFLDGYGPASLRGVSALPLVISGSPQHLILAAEMHLQPLMHEVGAQTPLGALALLESTIADEREQDAALADWIEERAALVRTILGEEER